MARTGSLRSKVEADHCQMKWLKHPWDAYIKFTHAFSTTLFGFRNSIKPAS